MKHVINLKKYLFRNEKGYPGQNLLFVDAE